MNGNLWQVVMAGLLNKAAPHVNVLMMGAGTNSEVVGQDTFDEMVKLFKAEGYKVERHSNSTWLIVDPTTNMRGVMATHRSPTLYILTWFEERV